MGVVMIFPTVILPRLLLVETARRTISVSVTIPTSFFPFFTNSDPTRAVRIFLAALTIDTPGPTVLGCLRIIFSTVDILPPFYFAAARKRKSRPALLTQLELFCRKTYD